MTSTTPRVSGSTPELTEFDARLMYAGEIQHELAAAERAALRPGLDRPEPHVIKALTLLANRIEREDAAERDADNE